MPTEFNLIQRADLQQRLTRGLEIRGEKSPARTLDPTVQACVILEDLTRQITYAQPGDRLCAGGDSLPALAGNGVGVSLGNLAGSGLIVVVHAMTLSALGTCNFLWGRGNANFNALGGAYFDTRHGLGQTSANLTSGYSAASPITQEMGRISVGTTTSPGEIIESVRGFVVNEGEIFTVWAETLNLGASVFLTWLEFIK